MTDHKEQIQKLAAEQKAEGERLIKEGREKARLGEELKAQAQKIQGIYGPRTASGGKTALSLPSTISLLAEVLTEQRGRPLDSNALKLALKKRTARNGGYVHHKTFEKALRDRQFRIGSNGSVSLASLEAERKSESERVEPTA